MVFCTKCGDENSDDAWYCKKCGQSLQIDSPSYSDWKKITLFLLAGFILISATSASMLLNNNSGPTLEEGYINVEPENSNSYNHAPLMGEDNDVKTHSNPKNGYTMEFVVVKNKKLPDLDPNLFKNQPVIEINENTTIYDYTRSNKM